jgi:hypothetical protein
LEGENPFWVLPSKEKFVSTYLLLSDLQPFQFYFGNTGQSVMEILFNCGMNLALPVHETGREFIRGE